MAKFTVLAAVLAALFVAASAYKTTVTTVVLEDEDNLNRPHRGQCSEQIQRQQQLSQCQQLIQQQSGKYIVMVGMRGADDVNPQRLQQCCQQLRQVEEQCRCQGLEKIVEQQQQQGRLQGQKLRQVIQSAENIPNMCQMSPQRCQIRVSEDRY